MPIVLVENTFLGAEGITKPVEQRIWTAGITHWDEFTPDCEAVPTERTPSVEQYIDRGREAVANGDVTYFDARLPSKSLWRVYESFRDRTCFFDIETTGLSHHSNVVTTVTVHQAGETATLVRGDDLTTESLRAAFEDAGLLVTFNGASFDIPFLEANFDVEVTTPHLDLMHTTRQIGLSGGLSAVEQHFGIGRELPDVDGRKAVELWHDHERGVDGALERLIAYNQEDTKNMVPVLERTVERLDDTVLPDRETKKRIRGVEK